MALRGTLTHRKTRRLAQALGIPPCYALGVLEALWHLAGEQAPNGAIGRMTDEDIAMEMFYDGDPAKLIAALVGAGLVDVDQVHRLLIHDWHIHSDDATDNKLARAGQRYANGEIPRMRRLSKSERAHAAEQYTDPCAHVRTAAHNGALPVPEPVPEPEPEEKDLLDESDVSDAPVMASKPAPVAVLVPMDAEIERVYLAYPRKVGKGKALLEIRGAVRHLGTGADWPVLTARDALSLLHEKTTRFARSPAGNAGDYTPHPATWFHQKRYLDDEKEWQRGSNQRNTGANRGQERVDSAIAALQRANAADEDSQMAR